MSWFHRGCIRRTQTFSVRLNSEALEAQRIAKRKQRTEARHSVAKALCASQILALVKVRANARKDDAAGPKKKSANAIEKIDGGDAASVIADHHVTIRDDGKRSLKASQLLSVVNDPVVLDSAAEIDAISPKHTREQEIRGWIRS